MQIYIIRTPSTYDNNYCTINTDIHTPHQECIVWCVNMSVDSVKLLYAGEVYMIYTCIYIFVYVWHLCDL